ncbi:hypothetical protein FCULG_00011986 [Fusarium culmorum]|uniref:Uncharacterized protein n=1 Tax=Fusarium culmorum TaxID=5516 RepID=A0A2T4GFY7_FUSCU|nr:hypothetical protein FCULG_00011986 [Fusarium culmorum]
MRRGGFMLGELRDKCRETFRRAMTILGPGRLRESIARVCVSTSASSEDGLAKFCLAQKQDARENPSRRMLARGGGVQLVRGEMIKKAAESPTSMPSDFHYSTVYTSPPWMLTR